MSNTHIWLFKLYKYLTYLVNPLLILQPILSKTQNYENSVQFHLNLHTNAIISE